jgi:tRNA A-37 threonylcarbamoyl transferase component Bud32
MEESEPLAPPIQAFTSQALPDGDIADGANEIERELAKSRADRAWREFRSMVYTSSELNNSIFAGAGHAELTTSIGNLRFFRKVKQSAPVLSTLLKLNLMVCSMVVFFFTFQIASSDTLRRDTFLGLETVGGFLPIVIVVTAYLTVLAGVVWFSQRPKRLKVLPNMLVLRTDLNQDFFSELVIPWQTVERVELIHKKLLGASEIETIVQISTALGVKHFIPLDDLLVDNSEASFINAVRTWAPRAARQLTFKRSVPNQSLEKGGRLTELWLHQFNHAQVRKESGMLPPGAELFSEGGSDNRARRTYTVLGVLGGGGQGNTYLALAAAPLALASAPLALAAAPLALASAPLVSAQADEVVLKEYIMPIYRGSAVLAKLSEKLADEANLLARLDHPLVVKVSDHFISDYRGYLVLEYVEGRSLKELVASEGPQPESFVVEVGSKLLDVLGYMHAFEPPIVHRDLSPDNVMLSVLGEIKVVDFNVARQLEGSAGSTVVGKHAYIPPEQFRGRPAPASDIYALGGTLYFLLTGQDPDPLSVSHPREINPKISVGLDQVVAQATALDLADRYASAGEMLVDLSRVLV